MSKSTNCQAGPRLAPPLKALTTLLVAGLLLVAPCAAQISDGDDQFQVVHQDIGRISGGASVAPQTTLVKQQHQHDNQQEAPAPAPLQPAALPPQPFERHQAPAGNGNQRHHQRQHHHQQATRKPNRITLAVRTATPVQVSLAPFEPAPAVRSAEPSQFASQLVAPPQPAHAFQSLSPDRVHHTLVAPATPVHASPALASFTSGSAEPADSSRHSALIAQVAAERAAAGALEPAPPTDFPGSSNLQPSLGSPIEALSSPAVAQVQPPPALHQHHHQASAAQAQPFFVNQPEEPIVAPSFEHVLGHGCPRKGVFSYENKDHCDRYYMCTNGTFTEEACPNGLAYSQMGAVYQHCAYNWNVDCGRKKTSEPLASPGCPWQFGIFPINQNGQCSIDYFVCEWGVPETKRCSPEGLFYDDRIKGCQWADQLGCKSEALLNFKCPPEDEDNPYWPYPRYYHNKQDIIVCVNEQPRLVHCNEDQAVDPGSLACMDLNKKKKKKF